MAKKRFFTQQAKEAQMQEDQTNTVLVLEESEVVDVAQEETQGAAEQVVLEATAAPTEAPVAPVLAQVASKYSEGLERLLTLCKNSGNTPLNNYVKELLDYAEKMAPGMSMPQSVGAANQASFYTTLINLIDHTGKDFRIGFATLLAIFNEYKRGAFSATHVLRFMEDVPLNKSKRNCLIKLVNLFSMTADAKTRKDALRHLDLKRELVGISEESKMRIVAFYTA